MSRTPIRGPRLLVTDRNALVLMERARIHVHGGRVVYYAADADMLRRFNLPHVNIAVLALGQGTSITQEAMALLAQEGVLVAFTGSGGTPLHMGTLVTYKATERFRALLPIYASPAASLVAAKSLMRDRLAFMEGKPAHALRAGLADEAMLNAAVTGFAADIEAAPDHETMMSAEGRFAKAVYAAFATGSGLVGFRRTPGAPEGDHAKLNAMIDHGNYLAYGVAGAAIWALGIPPHMSVMHGKTRPGGLVFDVADSWKDSIVIAAAVATAVRREDEADFRYRVTNAIEDHELIAWSLAAIDRMIAAAAEAFPDLRVDLHFQRAGNLVKGQ